MSAAAQASALVDIGSSRSPFVARFARVARAAGPAAPLRTLSLTVAGAADFKRLSVAITGATGFVGVRLVERLLAEGHEVKALTRSVLAAKTNLGALADQVQFADPGSWAEAVAGSDAVVNLAGEPITNRWSPEIKRAIKDSRVYATHVLAAAINACPEANRPRVFISSSAVGFYGSWPSGVAPACDEASPSGKDYLAEVCVSWEAAAREAKRLRTVLLRTGIVLDQGGGALRLMVPVFNLFGGGPLGSGQQWFSWIHRDDLCDLIVAAITDDRYEGPLNATAPNPVCLSEMCSALGRALGRPSWLPVPGVFLEMLLGEGARVVLEGQNVLPAKALSLGFRFKYGTIDAALKQIVSK